MSESYRIGIVGGGPGGLMTAYSIQRYAVVPCQLSIFEASNRLGGKIHTPKFQSNHALYEAGAAEIYDYSSIDTDPLKELIEELGLSTVRMEGASVICHNHVIANLDDVQNCLGISARRAVSEFDRLAHDGQTPGEFYHSNHSQPTDEDLVSRSFVPFMDAITDEKARRYIETMIHSDLATEPDKTNLEYGLQNYLMNSTRYMRLYSVAGGNELIIRELVARIQGHFRMEHRVTQIGRTSTGRIQITAEHQGRSIQEEFDFVVIALPNLHLPELIYQGEPLNSAMQRHIAHYNHPAHYLRITILFRKPFWRSVFPDSYCMLDQFGGCCLYDESSRTPGVDYGILGWLIAGSNADTMSQWDDQRLIEAALDSLPDFLALGRSLFVEGQIHRWVGAVNAMPGGNIPISLEHRHQPEPRLHDNLFIVGDYLYDSTLNGVLDSADFVAQWLVSTMIERSGVTL